MTSDQILCIAMIVFGVALIVAIVYPFWDLKKNKEKYEAEAEEYVEMKFAEEADVEAFRAEIVDMVCGTGMVGSYHLPKSQKSFLVVFKNENGELREICVSEDVYISLEVGMRGMLTLLNENLDSFELND